MCPDLLAISDFLTHGKGINIGFTNMFNVCKRNATEQYSTEWKVIEPFVNQSVNAEEPAANYLFDFKAI